jgi:hypothetical protein
MRSFQYSESEGSLLGKDGVSEKLRVKYKIEKGAN